MSVTVPTAQSAVLPLWAQPLVNAGFWLDGVELRATDTPAAEPFWAETVTPNVASCPRWTLACAGWTLTHSSAGAALELELAPAGAVVLALGLAVMYALSEAEIRADADGWDDDGDEDADPEGEPDPDGDPAADGDPEADGDPAADGEAEAEADGDTDGETAADGDDAAVGELDEDGDGEGDGEGDGDGEEDDDGDGDGDGEGDGEPEVGSTSQVVSVLEDEPELVPPRSGLSEPARAGVGEIASIPKISKLPASKLSVLARTCAKRIYIALSAQFVRLMYPLVHSEATR